MLAIARALAEQRELKLLLSALTGSERVLEPLRKIRIAGLQTGIAAARRLTVEVAGAELRRAATVPEIARGVAQQMGLWKLSTVLMYAAKASFDRAVASQLRGLDYAGVVGMFGSSSQMFAEARMAGRPTILNFVNSHPSVHNELLTEVAGVPKRSHECVPRRVAERVDQELERSSLILVPSKFVAQQLIRIGIACSRIAVIPYGVDRNLFRLEPGRPRSTQVRCLYVGQISYRKGVHVLMSAARRLIGAPMQFQLVGPIVSRPILQDMPGNVHWQRTVPHAELRRLLADSDILAVPSIEDAYPLVVLEALSCGTPVLISTNCGNVDLIINRRSGMVVSPGSVEDVVQGLEELVFDGDLRNRIREGAAAVRNQLPTWEDYGARVVNALRGLPERDDQFVTTFGNPAHS